MLQFIRSQRVRHDLVRELPRVPLRGEGSCGGGGAPRDSAGSGATHFHALEEEMATHSSVLAWRIPGMAGPGGLPSMGTSGEGLAPPFWRTTLQNGCKDDNVGDEDDGERKREVGTSHHKHGSFIDISI